MTFTTPFRILSGTIPLINLGSRIISQRPYYNHVYYELAGRRGDVEQVHRIEFRGINWGERVDRFIRANHNNFLEQGFDLYTNVEINGVNYVYHTRGTTVQEVAFASGTGSNARMYYEQTITVKPIIFYKKIVSQEFEAIEEELEGEVVAKNNRFKGRFGYYGGEEEPIMIIKNNSTNNNNCLLSHYKKYLKSDMSFKKLRVELKLKPKEKININKILELSRYCLVDTILYKLKDKKLSFIRYMCRKGKKCGRCIRLLKIGEHVVELHYMKKSKEVYEKIAELLLLNDVKKMIEKMKKFVPSIRYIFYDTEATQDTSINKQVPFLLGYSYCDYYDSLNNEEGIKSMITQLEKNYVVYYSFDCIINFIKDLFEMSRKIKNKKFLVYGFNNSKYDDIFIFNDMMKMNQIKHYITQLNMINKNSIFMTLNKNIIFRDVLKYLGIPLNLSRFAEAFSLKYKKLKELQCFKEINDMYFKLNNNKEKFLIEFEKSKYFKNFVLYLKHDVLALGEGTLRFFSKLKTYLNGFDSTKLTINSNLMGHYKSLYPEIMKLKCGYPIYKISKLTVVAGISFCKYNTILKNVYLGMYDVVSEYPYGLLYGEYPDITKQRVLTLYPKSNKIPENKCGFVYCEYKQINNKRLNILPVKIGDKPYDWTKKNTVITRWMTSTDFNELIKYGHKVKIIHTVLWDKIKGIEIFGKYVIPLMKIKSEQDYYKKNEMKEYNKPLREVVKLILNSFTGKANENKLKYLLESLIWTNKGMRKAFDEGYKIIKESFGAYDFYLKKTDTEQFDGIEFQKFQLLGTFIYANSRKWLQRIIQRIPLSDILVIETDSVLSYSKNFKQFKKETFSGFLHNGKKHKIRLFQKDYPKMKEKKYFGQFENELIKHEIDKKTGELKQKPPMKFNFVGYRKKCYSIVNSNWPIIRDELHKKISITKNKKELKKLKDKLKYLKSENVKQRFKGVSKKAIIVKKEKITELKLKQERMIKLKAKKKPEYFKLLKQLIDEIDTIAKSERYMRHEDYEDLVNKKKLFAIQSTLKTNMLNFHLKQERKNFTKEFCSINMMPLIKKL